MPVETVLHYWPWMASGALLIVHVIASIHVLLSRRNASSSIGWVGAIWLAPLLGPLLYFLLGINRIQRKARRLRDRPPRKSPPTSAAPAVPDQMPLLAPESIHLAPLVKLVGAITERPLTLGNRIQPLYNGEEAYPAMLQAIHEAKHSVALSVYIFNNDRAGVQFVEALGLAVARGVEVRVLIDHVGGSYTLHSAFGVLRRAGVPVASFLPRMFPRLRPATANLCNHRKLLIVDGRLGFTGGMNVTEDNCLSLSPRHPTRDLHFRLDGPIVAQLQEVFADDWEFSTDESLQGTLWFPEMASCGSVLARGISSGPDADLEKLHLLCCGALACAQASVRIVTPYFLPDSSLISALSIAALRGVQVDILVPRDHDLRLLQWASTTPLLEVLEYGCKVWLTPPPFTHTKLILVDGIWTLFGSGNWDARSFRLNFEFDVECHDRELAAVLEKWVVRSLEECQPLSLSDLNNRSFPVRLRDGIAQLLTPYL